MAHGPLNRFFACAICSPCSARRISEFFTTSSRIPFAVRAPRMTLLQTPPPPLVVTTRKSRIPSVSIFFFSWDCSSSFTYLLIFSPIEPVWILCGAGNRWDQAVHSRIRPHEPSDRDFHGRTHCGRQTRLLDIGSFRRCRLDLLDVADERIDVLDQFLLVEALLAHDHVDVPARVVAVFDLAGSELADSGQNVVDPPAALGR